jgi:hypothetical protein
MYRVKIGLEWFEVDENHLWAAPNGWWPQHSLLRGDRIINVDGKILTVDSVEKMGKGEYVKIFCERRRYRLGSLIGHNATTGY